MTGSSAWLITQRYAEERRATEEIKRRAVVKVKLLELSR